METLKKRLEEQKGRHQGGIKWIGTAGTSPFGAYGYNPEGVRIGQHESRNRRAVKVWDQREFRNLDDSVELGTRNIKVALKRLRKFAREGNPEELDLDDTVRSTARNAGWLDIKMVPERHNSVKVLLFLDIGGSMDDHVQICEQLFSAARTEFKHLEYFYFHNFLYERVWKDNRRRAAERMRDLGRHAQVSARLQGDLRRRRDHEPVRNRLSRRQRRALEPGGRRGVDAAHARRLQGHRSGSIRSRESVWDYHESIGMTRELIGERMFPLTHRRAGARDAPAQQRALANPMALKATIFKADLQIADMDRNYYNDHALTIARHPSETDERMMVRLLAFAAARRRGAVIRQGLERRRRAATLR